MINVLIQVAVTAVAWFILMIVCTNLIGFLVRGFFANPQMEEIIDGNDVLTAEYRKDQGRLNVIAAVLLLLFLAALYYFKNVGLVIAALILMGARIPDLISEIRHGQRKTSGAYILLGAVSWASVPVVWYALYRM